MNDIRNKILEIIIKHIGQNKKIYNEENFNKDDIKDNDDLIEFGMDSITFIIIILDIEEYFGIEIPDEKLFPTEMQTIEDMEKIVFLELENSYSREGLT